MIDLGLYAQASFRGIPFHVEKSSRRSAHRVDIKAYPFQSSGLVTDMGLDEARFDLTIYVLGDDALARRRDLEEAFDRVGPGALVHPTRGALRVQVTELRDDEVFTELGVADFTVSFVLSGKQSTPRATIDTQAAVTSASTFAEATVADSYDFGVSSEASSASGFEQSTIEAAEISELQQGFAQVAGLFQQGTNLLNSGSLLSISDLDVPLIRSAGGVIGSGLKFSNAAFSFVRSYVQGFGDPLSIVTGLIGQLAPNSSALWSLISGSGLPGSGLPGSGSNPFQSLLQKPAKDRYSGLFYGATEEADNSASRNSRLIARIFFDAGAIEAAKVSSSVEFSDLVQATRIRDAIGEALSQAVSATPTSDPVRQAARRSALRSLRTAVFRDITERATLLPKLEIYTPAATQSARVLAYRLNGSLNEQTDIATRNAIRHPSFVPAGSPLFYLEGNRNGG